MLHLTAARGAGEAGRSVLTHHQHKHTEEEGRRGERRGERRGSYIRHRQHRPTAAQAKHRDKGR